MFFARNGLARILYTNQMRNVIIALKKIHSDKEMHIKSKILYIYPAIHKLGISTSFDENIY